MMIKSDQDLENTQERVRQFVRQVAQIRKTESNPENYRMSAAGFLAEIDRMNLEVRDYLWSFPANIGDLFWRPATERNKMYLTKNKKEKCIMARVMRQTRLYQANFSLKKYGTWSKATRAARQWLNKTLPTLPPKVESSSKDRMTSRNHSGVVGVHRTPGIVRKRNGNVYECPRYVAGWPGCEFSGGLSWSVKQFEEEGAFALAVIARRRETINRDSILTEFESIIGTKKYRDIVALMEA